MKKIISIIMVLVLGVLLVGCSTENGGPKEFISNIDDLDDSQSEEISYQPVTLKEMTSTGEIFYDDFAVGEFSLGNADKLYVTYNEDIYTYLNENIFPFSYDRKQGYADAYGNVIIDAKYDDVYLFSEDKALVVECSTNDSSKKTYKIIDISGKELFTIPAGYYPNLYDINPYYRNGKIILVKNEGISAISVLIVDENMHTTTFKINERVEHAREINTPDFAGVLIHSIKSKMSGYDNVFTLYDAKGKKVWSQAVSKGYGKYNDNGAESPLTRFVAKNGYFNVINADGKWGLMDIKTYDIKIECKYDYLGAYSDGLIEICRYGKWGYIDLEDKEIIKPAFVYANPFVNGRAFVIQVDDQYAVIDKTGNVVANYTGLGFSKTFGKSGFDMVTPFTTPNGIAGVTAGYKQFSLIGADGSILLTKKDTSSRIFINDKYVFDGEKMYEVVEK